MNNWKKETKKLSTRNENKRPHEECMNILTREVKRLLQISTIRTVTHLTISWTYITLRTHFLQSARQGLRPCGSLWRKYKICRSVSTSQFSTASCICIICSWKVRTILNNQFHTWTTLFKGYPYLDIYLLLERLYVCYFILVRNVYQVLSFYWICQHNMVIMEAKDAARTLSDSDFLTL